VPVRLRVDRRYTAGRNLSGTIDWGLNTANMFVQQTPDENTQVGDGRPASACPPMSDVVVMSSGFKGFYKEEGCNELRAICVHMVSESQHSPWQLTRIELSVKYCPSEKFSGFLYDVSSCCSWQIFAPFNRVEGVWRDANGEFMLSGSYTNDEIHLVIKSNASVFCRSLVGCRKKTDLITGRWSDPSGSSSEHASSGEFLLSNEEAESRFAPSFDGKRLILYNFVEQIAQGAFGPISLVRRVVDGRMLVCKEIHYAHMNDNERRMAITEVNVLHDVEHQNVVKYYDAIVCHQQLKLFLVTEHCSKGNLSNLIQLYKSQDHQMTETFIWRTLEQILLVLQLLQGREEAILHGDLKPANILMDDKLMVKVAGFGLAAVFKNDEVACTKVGTPVCLPPEQISGVGFAVKSEIWALGCIAYEMAALKPPFDASSQHKSEGCIRTGKVEGIPQGYSPCLYDAICWMLQPDPKDRPSVSDLLRYTLTPRLGCKQERHRTAVRSVPLLFATKSRAPGPAAQEPFAPRVVGSDVLTFRLFCLSLLG
jgi:serine/threonine protein kinase